MKLMTRQEKGKQIKYKRLKKQNRNGLNNQMTGKRKGKNQNTKGKPVYLCTYHYNCLNSLIYNYLSIIYDLDRKIRQENSKLQHLSKMNYRCCFLPLEVQYGSENNPQETPFSVSFHVLFTFFLFASWFLLFLDLETKMVWQNEPWTFKSSLNTNSYTY